MNTELSKDPEVRLAQALGHTFSDPSLLLMALTHRSYVNETNDPGVKDNERFEFLGDAVIDLVVSTELMKRFPESQEGTLSKMRAAIVSEGALAEVARKICLGDALRLGRGEALSGGREKDSILSDAFEAVIAAVYQDSDFLVASQVLLGLLDFSAGEHLARGDAKTQLQHRFQAERQLTPSYRLVEAVGPEHEKRFLVEVMVDGEVLGQGEGRSKKDAEQRAAAKVLDSLDPPAEAKA